jgi:hypothetical protein
MGEEVGLLTQLIRTVQFVQDRFAEQQKVDFIACRSYSPIIII